MKRTNLITLREDLRRLGLVLVSAGLLAGVLEDTDMGLVLGLVLAGAALVWFGNQEDMK